VGKEKGKRTRTEKKHSNTKYTARTSVYLLFQDICVLESEKKDRRGKQFKHNSRMQNSKRGKM